MDLAYEIEKNLPFEPTEEQRALIVHLCRFIFDRDSHSVFLLRGYAGTGKTSVTAALIRTMRQYKQRMLLMAPTGRAAKVMSNYSGVAAYTIHKKIYRQKSMGDSRFCLDVNNTPQTFVIADEASMISNTANALSEGAAFGSGRLLDDLISYVYCDNGCRLMLVGDDAQLPPVGQVESPALNDDELRGYGLSVYGFTLRNVIRQNLDSGILKNATIVRSLTESGASVAMPRFDLSGTTNDFIRLSGAELIDTMTQEYRDEGAENVIAITRSNRQALAYNRGIRAQILMREDEIGRGDLVMVTKNNYFWTKDTKEMEFIANGDIAEVVKVKGDINLYDRRFLDLTLRFVDYDCEIDCRVLAESLYTETPAHAAELTEALHKDIEEDYMDIGNRRERLKKMKEDPYYNALQIKFAYAVTCHKAQGGQWDVVFVDQGALSVQPTDDYYHWLYTALTRATKRLYVVNFPNECFGASEI